ncbi:MAG: hypothetical protein DRP79_07045 [Planctomycetota bacterium]|nr:MAG: hypothetical protein DRP79_07045 [Planctomycetota bacterium]
MRQKLFERRMNSQVNEMKTTSNDLKFNLSGVRNLRRYFFDSACAVLGAENAKFLFKMYDLARFDIFGRPRYNFGSVDITYRCNLNCKHCYFKEYGFDSELSDEEWLNFFAELSKTDFPFYQCSWIGGEPLMRKDLVGRCRKFFQSNVVATNGTIPLPDWPDVNFYVSVDGTRDWYKDMRGSAEHYDRIKKNCDRPDLKIIISMVITKDNHECIEDLLDEWRKTHIKAVMFQFFTPIGPDDSMWPGWELRDEILDRLLALKEKYGSFIDIPAEVYRMMKSDRCREITKNCGYRKYAFCYDPTGKTKRPCMMGPQADCTRCGCVLPFHLALLDSKSLLIRELFRSIRLKLFRRRREQLLTTPAE